MRPVEELYRDIFNLLLVYHSEMHPVIHIILAEGMGSAIHGRHSLTQPGEAAAVAPYSNMGNRPTAGGYRVSQHTQKQLLERVKGT